MTTEMAGTADAALGQGSTAQTVNAPSHTTLVPPTVTPPDQPLPLMRALGTFIRNPIATLPRGAYENPITVSLSLGRRVAWVSDPSLVEQILVQNGAIMHKTPLEQRVFRRTARQSILLAEGDAWKWQRRVLAPLFRPGEIDGYVPTIARIARQFCERWPSGGVRDVGDDMRAVTFRIIAETTLAGGAPDEAQEIHTLTDAILTRITWEAAWGLVRLPTWMPHPASWFLSRKSNRVRAIVRDIVQRRVAAGGLTSDMLGRLIAARDPETDAPMDQDQVIDNVIALLAAGHDTTAHTLTFALYLAASAPEWQETLRREHHDVVGDGEITADAVTRLKQHRQFICETLRLYPAVPVMARCPASEIEIAGYRFDETSQIVIPIFAIHRHRALWSDPDRFDPCRFATDDDRLAYPRTQFMPFGAGPRICLGQTLAMAEATILLATFVRRFQFTWAGTHTPTPMSRVTLRPMGGMPLKIEALR